MIIARDKRLKILVVLHSLPNEEWYTKIAEISTIKRRSSAFTGKESVRKCRKNTSVCTKYALQVEKINGLWGNLVAPGKEITTCKYLFRSSFVPHDDAKEGETLLPTQIQSPDINPGFRITTGI